MNLLGIFQSHVIRDLSAFCHGEMPAEELQRVAEHLDGCSPCRRACEEVRLGVTLAGYLPRLSTPASLWNEIATRHEERRRTLGLGDGGRHAPGLLTSRPIQAFLVVLVVGIGVAAYLRLGRPGGKLELGEYLKGVETASPLVVYQRIVGAPHSFYDVEKDEVLRVAGFTGPPFGAMPLPAYELVVNRLATVSGARVAQLVYGKGEETFAVFVAPAGVRFDLGKESVVGADLQGIRCQRVDCPKQETYVFGAGHFHCVLVSKSMAAGQIAAVMRYFIAAHERLAEKG